MTKRSLHTLSLTLLLSGCIALTNFGEFVFEDLGSNSDLSGVDLTGADLTPPPDLACGEPASCTGDNTVLVQCGVRTTCRCIPAGAIEGTNGKIEFPAHCPPTPSNGINAEKCLADSRGQIATIGSSLTVDTTKQETLPQINELTKVESNGVMLLCAGSIVGRASEIKIVGTRPLLIIADSVIDLGRNVDNNTPSQILFAGDFARGSTLGRSNAGIGNGGAILAEGAPKETGGNRGHLPSVSGGSIAPGGGSGGGNLTVGGIGGRSADVGTGTNGQSALGGGKLDADSLIGGGGGGGGATFDTAKIAAGSGGGGAGAVQLTAGAVLRLVAKVNGTGGAGGAAQSSGTNNVAGGGGGGGGAGGMLWIEAPDVQFANDTCLSVYGGAGGNGGGGMLGGDPAVADEKCPYLQTPGNRGGSAGGNPNQPINFAGVAGGGGKGAGGGAGSPGKIVIRSYKQVVPNAVMGNVFPIEALRWKPF